MIGRFALFEALGEGGTATVWRARDPLTGQPAAVKVLHDALTLDPAQRDRFLAEARLTAQVSHPGIVRIIDCGEHERPGQPPQAWVAMELLEGHSLLEYVRAHGPLPVEDALVLGETLLTTLDAVHREGLVHRDVTPANIMLRITPGLPLDPATIRLCDFGVAGLAGTAPAAAGAVRRESDGKPAALPAFIWGSASYLSPEHAAGRPVFASADLYQLGGVLYFALTGQAPFARDSIASVMQAHLIEQAPAPSTHRAELSPAVDRLVLRALRKAPQERYASALEMQAQVRATRMVLAENAVITAPLPVVDTAALSHLGEPALTVTGGSFALPRGVGTSLDLATVVGPHRGDAAPRRSRMTGRALWVAGTATVAALLAAGSVLGVLGERAAPQVSAVSEAAPQPTVEAPPVTPAPASQRLTLVPELLGVTLEEARARLAAAGLTLGQVDTTNSALAAETLCAAHRLATDS